MDRLGTDSRKRVRVRKACLPCASRKRKCDGTFPCATCRAYGYECQYRSAGAESSRLDSTPIQRQGPTSLQQSNYLHGIAVPMAGNERALQQVPTRSRGPEVPEQVQETSHGLLVVSPTSKYLGRHSAQAFPRFLGLKMQSQVLPKLQPFAWNMEIRPKAVPKARPAVSSLITLDAARSQLNSFFRSKFPACSFLDLDVLSARCEQHWAGQLQGLPFEALICGIISVASIVVSNSIDIEQESAIVSHAETILNDQEILAEANIEVLAALLLHQLYLRATASPQVVWLMSCTAMHMAESLGLHKQYSSSTGRPREASSEWSDKAKSNLFWIICSGNRLFAHELGRSPVRIHEVTLEFPYLPSDNSGVASFCRLCYLLPVSDSGDVSEQFADRFLDALQDISGTQYDQPFLSLIAADVCFIVYRRICVSSSHKLSNNQLKQVVMVGREAVQAAEELLSKRQMWWNMLSTLFQFCCVLISIDTNDSLAHLQGTMMTINKIREYSTGENVAQAMSTLKALIAASRRGKEAETAYLTTAEAIDMQSTTPAVPEASFSTGLLDFVPPTFSFDDFDWTSEDLDWIFSGAPLGQ